MLSNLARMMCGRLGNRQFNRIGGSLERSIEFNDIAFGGSRNANGSPANILIHMFNGVTMANPQAGVQAQVVLGIEEIKVISLAVKIGVSSNVVAAAASLIDCSILTAPFNYLGVKNFFYGVDGSDRKLAWIGWNMVLTLKKNGAIFGNKGALDTHKLIPRRSPWQDVILAIHSLQSKGEVALKVLYKRLYALEMCKSISVAEKMSHPSLSHSFRRMPRGGVKQENYRLLCSKVADLVLPNISDRWCWSLEGSQEFSVKSSRILIDNTILPKAEFLTRWLRVVPIKVNVHAWRVCLDKLPTRANLSLRGMDIPSIACPIWIEDVSHLFFQCDMARGISDLLCRWWNISQSSARSYGEWCVWFASLRLGSRLKSILEGVFSVAWWCIWKFRNQLLFSSQSPRKNVIFDDIVMLSFTWSHARCFWKDKETMFPVLSRMAMDLRSVQASSVAFESAFSTSGRVLSIRRTRLTPASLEMCMCLKDHLDAIEPIPLSDEEIALDASSEGTLSSGGPRTLGKPLVMDNMTASMCHNGVGRAAYAEVPLEIEAGKGFLDKIEGESFLMTEEEIKNQKKVEQDIKVDLSKKVVDLGREKLVDLLRRAQGRITNCDVLSRGKGPITLKVYMDDGFDEIIQNFKASDLHLGEWREVMQVCPNRAGAGWTTIYSQIHTKMDNVHKTKKELELDFNKPLGE
nr:RNA-directed DNA polymerase, eukaryota [Tanacetum cinerariifolium]